MRDHLSRAIEYVLNKGEDVSVCLAYAEPGYTDPDPGVIVIANWNTPLGTKLGRIVERLGHETEWSDEWYTCDECQRAVRSCPDGHDWRPHFWSHGSDTICADCLVADDDLLEEYETDLLNNARRADTIGIDWRIRGFERLSEKYETGLHEGMDDQPETVLAKYREDFDVLFEITSTEQFCCNWIAWIRRKGQSWPS